METTDQYLGEQIKQPAVLPNANTLFRSMLSPR